MFFWPMIWTQAVLGAMQGMSGVTRQRGSAAHAQISIEAEIEYCVRELWYDLEHKGVAGLIGKEENETTS